MQLFLCNLAICSVIKKNPKFIAIIWPINSFINKFKSNKYKLCNKLLTINKAPTPMKIARKNVSLLLTFLHSQSFRSKSRLLDSTWEDLFTKIPNLNGTARHGILLHIFSVFWLMPLLLQYITTLPHINREKLEKCLITGKIIALLVIT